ncbi:MAG: DUF5132 domain-containing protein [Rhodobacterales bacterium]|nr:DUF5132 domain-containing protein [Rhodobacterales bacterium]
MDRKYLVGAALAVGAVMLVPGVAAAVGRAARPVVRAAFRTGTVACAEFRKAGAEVYENMEDLAAELRADMQRAEADEAAAAAADLKQDGRA